MPTAVPGDPITVAATQTLDGVNEPDSDVQVSLLAYQDGDGEILTARPGQGIPVTESGTYGYKSGTAAGNVNVPSGAQIKRVQVVAGGSVATVSILGGDTINIPAGRDWDEQLPGLAFGTSSTSDIVIGGSVVTYYVSWVV